MRFILVVTAVAASMLLDLRTSRAYEGPWCAVTNIGREMSWNCSMRTFEMCRQEVIAGNRGWCNPNPRWGGVGPTEGRPSRRRSGY